MRVHTETGSYYDLDLKGIFWSKNGGYKHHLWGFKTLPADPQPHNWGEANELLENRPQAEGPVVGERIYVSGRDEWYLSTPVVRIES